MKTIFPLFTAGLALCAALVASVPAQAAGAGFIRDQGEFFSESGKAEASRKIAELERRFKKDVIVETFKEIPSEYKTSAGAKDKAALNSLYSKWALRQARELRVNGIYVLLTRQPAHLQIEVGNSTQNRAFTLRDRDDLATLMLGKLRNKEFDQALLEGLNFVSATMASHVAPRPAYVANRSVMNTEPAVTTRNSSIWGWAFPIVICLLVIWAGIAIVRTLLRGVGGGGFSPGFSPGSAGMMGGSGGGGFFRSLLGGVFGAAAGMWLYDQFTGGHHGGLGRGSTAVSQR